MMTDTNGKVYTDLTGKFPIMSINRMKYILFLYHYNSNEIIIRPLKNRSDKETLTVYAELYQ